MLYIFFPREHTNQVTFWSSFWYTKPTKFVKALAVGYSVHVVSQYLSGPCGAPSTPPTCTHPGKIANCLCLVDMCLSWCMGSPGREKWRGTITLSHKEKSGELGDCTRLCPGECRDLQLQQHPKHHSCSRVWFTHQCTENYPWKKNQPNLVRMKARKRHHIIWVTLLHSQSQVPPRATFTELSNLNFTH